LNTSSFEDYQGYGAGGGVPPPQHPYAPQFDMTDPSFHNHSMAHHQQQQDMYQGTVFLNSLSVICLFQPVAFLLCG
jgi:hypothetical protein